MFKKLSLAFAALLLLAGQITAQQLRVCNANEVLMRQLQADPSLRQRLDAIENHTNQFIQSGGAQDRAVVTIPVVVHVVWNTSVQNVSDAQIQSQIAVLNADFRKANADVSGVPSVFAGLAADAEVNFCLAAQTPSGAATTGIERRQTTTTSFSDNDNVKFTSSGGMDAWDASKYLNLWVCKLGGGILGYAQFPGGGPASTDGVVITYTGFGTSGSATAPFNKGRTATHEVGHWLNLYHIWGDDGTGCSGSDNCSDTPNQADENYGCPTFPAVSCSNGPNGDMFMNYMDYSDDACMFMFTTGQKARIQALFAAGGSRVSLKTSPGCTPPSGGGTCAVPAGLSASGIAATSATLSWGAVSGATSYTLQWKLGTASTFTTVTGLGSTSYNLTGLTANTTYNYKVLAVCSSGSSAYSALSSFTTLASGGGCTDVYEPNNARTSAAAIPVNTTFTAQIASSTDKDWYSFANTTATKNIKIDLTTLPADYDVYLYKGTSSSYTAKSENAGTISEQIIYNTTTAASTYYAYIFGYNGVYSSTQCYTLRVSLSSTSWRLDGSTDGEVTEAEIPVVFADFGMFPNPATSKLTVEVPMQAETDVQVSIFDLSGRAALQQHRTLGKGDNRMIFDVQNLVSGVYFVQVRNGEQSSTQKLVISK